jgi:circadian clock protein KaiB
VVVRGWSSCVDPMRRFRGGSRYIMSRRAQFKFQLYVAGDAANSALAIANLAAICRTHLPNQHEIELVDVFREPKRALAEGIFMTPTLIKLAPLPVRRIVGTLSQTQPVLQALGLEVPVE